MLVYKVALNLNNIYIYTYVYIYVHIHSYICTYVYNACIRVCACKHVFMHAKVTFHATYNVFTTDGTPTPDSTHDPSPTCLICWIILAMIVTIVIVHTLVGVTLRYHYKGENVSHYNLVMHIRTQPQLLYLFTTIDVLNYVYYSSYVPFNQLSYKI